MNLKQELIKKGKDILGDQPTYSEIQMIEMCLDVIEGLQESLRISNEDNIKLIIKNKNLEIDNEDMRSEITELKKFKL